MSDDREQRAKEFLRQLFGDDGADEMYEHLVHQGIDPLAQFGDGPLPSPMQMKAALDKARAMFAVDDGPVNKRLAHDLARQTAVAEGDPALSGLQAKEVIDAFSVAELWLDAATSLNPAGGSVHPWCRSHWVIATLPALEQLMAPVATSMAEALVQVLGGEDEMEARAPEGFNLAAIGLGDLNPTELLRRLGAAAAGMQVGQAAGTLSREVFGATDLGLPLTPMPVTALLPTNINKFAEGLETPLAEVRQYLAVREAAHARLFAGVPWLRSYLLGLVEKYARGIEVDLDTLESRVRGADGTDPAALQKAMATGGIFGVTPTVEQQETLLQLETALALVEGWVDEVTAQAALPHIPACVPLRELLLRRRAAGGPAEKTFANLVGLELRPRRSRDAAKLFAHTYVAGGVEGRDAVWTHPDLLPGPIDLDDPAGYLARREAQKISDLEFDAALEQFLAGDES